MNNYQLVKNTEWKEVEINGEVKDIAKDWSVKKFNEFSSICRGSSPRPIQKFLTEKKDGTPWIKISDATKVAKYIDSTDQYIIKEGESRSRLVYPGELIVSNSATPGIPRFLNITACIHDGWLLLRNFNGVDKEFLFHLVGFVREKLKSQGSGSIFTNLSIDILSNFECLIPPIQTQSSIASILSEQESIIQDIESLISKYESRFQYLSDELLSGRLRVKEVDGEVVLYKNSEDNWKEVEINGEMKEIPKDWGIKKVKEFISYMSEGGTPPTSDKSFYDNGKIPWVVVEDIKSNIIFTKKRINEKGLKKIGNTLWEVGDIIMSTGATIGVVGKVGTPLATKQGVSGFKVNKKEMISDYLYYLFKNSTELFLKVSNGSTFKSLPQKDIKVLDFLYPILSEQILISQLLTQQEELINKQKELFIKEKQKFDWLLDNLLSGKYLIKE